MKYLGYYIVPCLSRKLYKTVYTFHKVGDSYTEPNWYYMTIEEVKLAIEESERTGRYPNPREAV